MNFMWNHNSCATHNIVFQTGNCSEFTCTDYSCLLSTQVCDSVSDCKDGEDELHCCKFTLWTMSHLKAVISSQYHIAKYNFFQKSLQPQQKIANQMLSAMFSISCQKKGATARTNMKL